MKIKNMIRVTASLLALILMTGCGPSASPSDEVSPSEEPSPVHTDQPSPSDEIPPDKRPDTVINARPFPTAGNYAVSPMLPTNITEDERHAMMISLFKEILLNNLIVDSNGPQDRDNFRMVLEHSGWGDGHVNVSESQGYGMIMMVYMSGCEDALGLSADQWRNGSTSLKDYYDAMLRTVIAFPSIIDIETNDLFCWQLFGDVNKGSVGEGVNKMAHFTQAADGDSATDGDMDIIFSLLLADKQWGGSTTFGGRGYKQIALDMLEDLWRYCVHDTYHTLLLGDWAKGSSNTLRNATRPSDFIISHLKAYKEADPAHDWQKVIDATYNVIGEIREAEADLGRDNGLLPDFVVRGEHGWKVPDGQVLESSNDNAYAYNSCRTPWRLGTDYLLFGDTEIDTKSLYETIIEPIDAFAQSYSGGEPGSLGPVYLDGRSIGWTDPSTFAASFLVSAAAAKNNQSWVNAFYEGWTEWRDVGGDNWQPFPAGIDSHGNNWYGDYIKLLAMIAANGYWWHP